MNEVRVELNSAGVRSMLKSPEMKLICEKYANKAVGRLGEGYSSSSRTMETRAIASVYAETYEAKLENAEKNTILKALR